jgi:hypothetical protein
MSSFDNHMGIPPRTGAAAFVAGRVPGMLLLPLPILLRLRRRVGRGLAAVNARRSQKNGDLRD